MSCSTNSSREEKKAALKHHASPTKHLFPQQIHVPQVRDCSNIMHNVTQKHQKQPSDCYSLYTKHKYTQQRGNRHECLLNCSLSGLVETTKHYTDLDNIPVRRFRKQKRRFSPNVHYHASTLQRIFFSKFSFSHVIGSVQSSFVNTNALLK